MRKKWSGLLMLLGGTLLSVFLLSVTPVQARVYVNIEPPAIQIETPGMAPSHAHVWVNGYHRWHRGAYVWVPGRWAVRPRHHVRWVPGHWERHHRGWYWVAGHWGR